MVVTVTVRDGACGGGLDADRRAGRAHRTVAAHHPALRGGGPADALGPQRRRLPAVRPRRPRPVDRYPPDEAAGVQHRRDAGPARRRRRLGRSGDAGRPARRVARAAGRFRRRRGRAPRETACPAGDGRRVHRHAPGSRGSRGRSRPVSPAGQRLHGSGASPSRRSEPVSCRPSTARTTHRAVRPRVARPPSATGSAADPASRRRRDRLHQQIRLDGHRRPAGVGLDEGPARGGQCGPIRCAVDGSAAEQLATVRSAHGDGPRKARSSPAPSKQTPTSGGTVCAAAAPASGTGARGRRRPPARRPPSTDRPRPAGRPGRRP